MKYQALPPFARKPVLAPTSAPSSHCAVVASYHLSAGHPRKVVTAGADNPARATFFLDCLGQLPPPSKLWWRAWPVASTTHSQRPSGQRANGPRGPCIIWHSLAFAGIVRLPLPAKRPAGHSARRCWSASANGFPGPTFPGATECPGVPKDLARRDSADRRVLCSRGHRLSQPLRYQGAPGSDKPTSPGRFIGEPVRFPRRHQSIQAHTRANPGLPMAIAL
jgi:hypothetical protein